MKHEYFLMAKTCQSFVKYNGDAVRLSQKTPHTVESVWVGVKRHPEKMRSVTTFKDKEGNVLERIFDFADGFSRNRLYERSTSKINNDEKVTSTFIKEFKIKKRMLPAYFGFFEDYGEENISKTILWTPIKYIANHVARMKNNEIVHSKVSITNMEKPSKEQHSFVEYPHIKNGKIRKTGKKVLSYTVNSLYNIVKSFDQKTRGVKFPKEDSFLAYRALSINDAIEPMTQKFVRDRGLKHADIKIFPEYYPKNEDEKLYGAHFDPEEGTINFNIFYRPPSKTRLAGTSAHESEHGWQYFLKSLAGGATTNWEYDMYEKFGPICDGKLLREAKRYNRYVQNYTPLTAELKEAGKINEYKDSELENAANKAGAIARARYDREGKAIRKAFPHIPEKFV